MDWGPLAIIIACLMAAAFFSASETALAATSHANMMQLARHGHHRAALVIKLITTQERLIGALLIGAAIANIAAVATATYIFATWSGATGVLYAIMIMTVLVVALAGVLPKTLALKTPDRVALAVARPVTIAVALLSPLVWLISAIVRALSKLLRLQPSDGQPLLTPMERLRGAVDRIHHQGGAEKHDRDMLGGLLDLRDLEVSDVMIHRTEMVMVNADLPSDELIRDVLATEFTRVPLWRDKPENIVGVLHAKDLLRAIRAADGDMTRIDINAIALPPWFVPDMRPVSEQLKAFRRRKTHFALVVDEYGEVEGIVTLEDILEEIVGDISDEHDVVVPGVRPQPDGSVVVDGAVPIRDLNRAMDWRLPDEEATTIAGLVIHEARSIPERGQSFTFYGFRFQMLRRERNRITVLRITPIADENRFSGSKPKLGPTP